MLRLYLLHRKARPLGRSWQFGFLLNPLPQDSEGDSAWLQLCVSPWACGWDCKVAVLGIFQVFSLSISDGVARGELVLCSIY